MRLVSSAAGSIALLVLAHSVAHAQESTPDLQILDDPTSHEEAMKNGSSEPPPDSFFDALPSDEADLPDDSAEPDAEALWEEQVREQLKAKELELKKKLRREASVALSAIRRVN